MFLSVPGPGLPFADHRHIAADSAERKGQILTGSRTVEAVITVGVENPEKARPEHADFTGATAIPITNHWHVAGDAAVSKCLVASGAVNVVESAVAVSIQDPVEAQPEQTD